MEVEILAGGLAERQCGENELLVPHSDGKGK